MFSIYKSAAADFQIALPTQHHKLVAADNDGDFEFVDTDSSAGNFLDKFYIEYVPIAGTEEIEPTINDKISLLRYVGISVTPEARSLDYLSAGFPERSFEQGYYGVSRSISDTRPYLTRDGSLQTITRNGFIAVRYWPVAPAQHFLIFMTVRLQEPSPRLTSTMQTLLYGWASMTRNSAP